MKKFNTFIGSRHASAKFIVSGAVLFGMLQVPVMPAKSESALPIQAAYVTADQVESNHTSALADVFLGIEVPVEDASSIVEEKMEFVSTRKAYPASLAVIQKHEKTIRAKARKYNVPEDVAIGIGLLENGGSDTAKSPAGALGVFQLMPGTARNLGLTVNGKMDERRNPEKNIDAGMRYLAKNYDRFGDWGLSTWAYHAGEGNVSKALQLYAKANHGINLPGIKNFRAMRDYVEEYNITIHKLLSDPAVQKHTRKLNDDSSGYPYKVIATSELFKEASVDIAVDVR